MGQELLPCPFCGDRDDFNPSLSQSHKYAEPGDPETGKVGNPEAGLVPAGHYVECDKCGACGANEDTEDEARAAWNQRAGTPPDGEIGALVERLRRTQPSKSGGLLAELGMHRQPLNPDGHEAAKVIEAFAAHQEELPALVRLLRRYRDETPPGHSPHMICHEVDEVLERCAAIDGDKPEVGL